MRDACARCGAGAGETVMQRWLCILMLVFPIAIANGPAAAQTQFDLAEQHLIDCATHADLHPPYGGTNTVWEVCHNEMEGYERTCMARVGRMPHTKDECRGAAYSLAMALQKRDPIDVQFVNCLRSKGPANAYPVELLSFCR